MSVREMKIATKTCATSKNLIYTNTPFKRALDLGHIQTPVYYKCIICTGIYTLEEAWLWI